MQQYVIPLIALLLTGCMEDKQSEYNHFYTKNQEMPQMEQEVKEELGYITTVGWTPVFGGSDISHILSIPGTDSDSANQYWREGEGEDEWNPDEGLQFVAAPGEVFEVLSRPSEFVYEVKCESCYYKNTDGFSLYIAPKDITSSETIPEFKKEEMPSSNEILDKIKEMANQEITYGWGGNAPIGEPLSLHPSIGSIENYGVDCSGLLYHATNQLTPRNTGDFLSFGKAIEIEGLTTEEIAAKLEPLDVIVWKGHMMIVSEDGKLIESRFASSDSDDPSGVHIRDLVEALAKTMEDRTPVNNYDSIEEGTKGFVVRRFVQS